MGRHQDDAMTPYHKVLHCAIVVLVLLITGSLIVQADTASCEVFGDIDDGTIWSADRCNPYIVTGNVKVPQNSTLTIEPGTTVKFSGQTILEVNGTLIVQGNAEHPILFTSNANTPAQGDWGHIQFNDTSKDASYATDGRYESGNIIAYAIIEYAGGQNISNNGAIRLSSASPLLEHLTIRNNKGFAVTGGGDDLRMIHSTVIDNERGIYLSTGYSHGTALISRNTVVNNQGDGIYLISIKGVISDNTIRGNRGCGLSLNSTLSGTPIISGNVIENNQDGGLKLWYGRPLIQSNTIIGNVSSSSGPGIYVASGSPTVEYTTIMSNTSGWRGGGVYVSYNSRVHIHHSSITHNSAQLGGGIYLDNSTSATMNSSNVYGNTATEGSAIYNGSNLPINAADNYWQATDERDIEAQIWHFVDDAAKGSVTYKPYSTLSLDISPPSHSCYLPLVVR